MVLEPETPKNVGVVCDDCGPKPNPKALNYNVEWYIGKYVELGFPTSGKDPEIEHMWVKVTHCSTQEGIELAGTLCNNPIFVKAKHGDVIEFDRGEIEKVLKADGETEIEL